MWSVIRSGWSAAAPAKVCGRALIVAGVTGACLPSPEIRKAPPPVRATSPVVMAVSELMVFTSPATTVAWMASSLCTG